MYNVKQRIRHPRRTTLGVTICVILFGILMSRFVAMASAEEADTQALAEKLIDLAGIDRGLCAVLGCDRDLPVQIVQSTKVVIVTCLCKLCNLPICLYMCANLKTRPLSRCNTWPKKRASGSIGFSSSEAAWTNSPLPTT